MTTNVDNLTPFDTQVLNIALLSRAQLRFSATQLEVPQIGIFELKNGAMQLLHVTVLSRHSRLLSPEGGRRLADLHAELLTQPLDTVARDKEMRADQVGLSSQDMRIMANNLRSTIDSQLMQEYMRQYADHAVKGGSLPSALPPDIKLKWGE